MSRPPRDNFWSSGTAPAARQLERAALAIGRLDARISVSPVRTGWVQRAGWSGFAEALGGDGSEIDEIDIFGLACDVPLPGRPPIAFARDGLSTLAAWQQTLAGRDSPPWRAFVPAGFVEPDDWRDRPALLRALDLLAWCVRADGGMGSWLMLPSLLAGLGVTRTPLPCLVVTDRALRQASPDRAAALPRLLKALAARAEAGLDRLDAIERERMAAAAAIATAHRPGRLGPLVALLQHRPVLSPLAVSHALRLTISGAGKLLSRAEELGLVREVSGRMAWRIYLPPDLATAFGLAAPPRGRPRAGPPPLPPGQSLDDVLDRFDREMAEFEARYGTSGDRPPG